MLPKTHDTETTRSLTFIHLVGIRIAMSSADEAAARVAAADWMASEYLKPPPALANILNTVKPVLTPAIKITSVAINLIGPLYLKLFDVGCYAYEKLPSDLFQSLIGLGLAFCGGAYCTSIAAIEAFRMSGWETTRAYLLDIKEESATVWAAHDADNAKDADGNAKSDVVELLEKGEYFELLKRKLGVTAVAIKDPSKLALALGGVYTAWLAVQGTLRLEFAKTITLGLAIADLAQPTAQKLLIPPLTHVVPKECASTRASTSLNRKRDQPLCMHLCMHLCMQLCMHLCMHLCACTCACTCTFAHQFCGQLPRRLCGLSLPLSRSRLPRPHRYHHWLLIASYIASDCS